MVLAATDIDRLEADIKESRLPDTEGFFFGDSDGSETTRFGSLPIQSG
jgi:hypothetical protein